MSQIDHSLVEVYYSIMRAHPEIVGNFGKLALLATEFSELNDFLRKIKPIVTNHPLIRVGAESDGGYLIPDDLQDISNCFSPGVDVTASFELDLVKRGLTCFLADYSVDSPPFENSKFIFEKKYLGTTNDDVNMTLKDWVDRNVDGKDDLILQMDIEGSEYPVVCNTDFETLRRFRIIVIEFHSLYRLCDKQGFDVINSTFSKILIDFDVVHIHPNNNSTKMVYGIYEIPSLLEFTFLRKDRISKREFATKFPHQLDRPNISGEDVYLPGCWYL